HRRRRCHHDDRDGSGTGSLARAVEEPEHGCRLVGSIYGYGDVPRRLQHGSGPAAHVMEHLVADPGRDNTAADSTGAEVRGADARAGASGLREAARRIGITAKSGRVWVSGLIFGCYTVQWMAVVGFLRPIYEGFGLSPIAGGLLTAVVVALNAVGAIISGSLLHRGANGRRMLMVGFVLMAITSTMTFVFTYPPHLLWIQMIAVGLFSISGATIPTTMTRVAVDLAPAGGSAPASMGLIQ